MAADPLTIVGTCFSLIASIGKLSTEIYSFVSRVREAHRDLDAVLKELSSLGLCLETLRNDAMVTSKRVPPPLEHRVVLVLVNTAEVVQDMNDMLDTLSSDKFGNKMRWAIYGQADMNKLRSRLESHKASLEITLALLTLSLTTAIKDDTSSIRRNIKGNAMTLDQITEALTALPERIALQLHGETLRLNASHGISAGKDPLLLAPAAPTMDSAQMLGNLFPPTTVDEAELLTHRNRFRASNGTENPGNPVGVGASNTLSPSTDFKYRTPTEVMRARRLRIEARNKKERAVSTGGNAVAEEGVNTVESTKTPKERVQIEYPRFSEENQASKIPHWVDPLGPVQNITVETVPGRKVAVPYLAIQQQSHIQAAEHIDVQEHHNEAAGGTRMDKPEAAADASKPPQTYLSPGPREVEPQYLSQTRKERDSVISMNPKLHAAVEDAIRRLVLPELDVLKQGRGAKKPVQTRQFTGFG